jgi:thiamine biosynthesis lipoprotein
MTPIPGDPSGSLSIFGIDFGAMASRCEIRIAASDEAQARALAQPAIDEVRRIEHKFSRYRDDSIVARINASAGGRPVECDDETASLLDYANALYDASGGRFDITSGVLRRVWDFRSGRPPEQARIDAVLGLIGWRAVERDGRAIRLPRAGMEIDFGGFGKEYAADCAATVLARLGAQAGFVNLGGDLRVFGPRPDGEPWSIAIQDPRRPEAIAASIPVARGGLATSGDYERYFELDGRRYCHILDPRTGIPVTAWRSVTVIAPLAIAAGSCSTIAMLMAGQGLEFLESTGYDFLAIDASGRVFHSTPRPAGTGHPETPARVPGR